MLLAVGLQVAAAVVLKLIADASLERLNAWIVGGIGVVLVLNLLRLVVWGAAHRRFPLSSTFPLGALFFPAMLIVALVFGDEVSARQIAGAVLITAGTVWINWQVNVK